MFQDVAFIFKTPFRAKVAAFFIRQPGEWRNAADVAAILGSTKSVVSKECSALLRFGILTSKRTGTAAVYTVNDSDDLFGPLSRFLAEIATPTDKEIIDALRDIRGITLIVAGGLLAAEPKSSVELLIVGKSPDVKKIEKAIKKLEAYVAIPIRYAVLEVGEYYERRQAYDRMLRDLFEFKHRVTLEKGR